ncbi:MAG TPA: DUF2452 domain-containing protein, partial [Flavobacteriales bacterium]|nr:DUF2452 domain-containing protein [Flavobacteriales bacterium]
QQAKDLNQRVHISERVYVAEMRFEPIIGRIYYLYEREDGMDVMSLIAPNEWGRSRRIGRYRAKIQLLADHTWEVLDLNEE